MPKIYINRDEFPTASFSLLYIYAPPPTHPPPLLGCALSDPSRFCLSLRHLLYKASIQSGQHFCVIDVECSTLMHNETIMESQKMLLQIIISIFKAADNDKSKFRKICVLTNLK